MDRKKLEKQLFIRNVQPGELVHSSFLVRHKETMISRNGKPYLALQLADKTGAIDTRVWENAEKLGAEFAEGDVVAVLGKPHLFQNRLQLVVDHIAKIPADEVDLSNYLPVSDANLEETWTKLVTIFEKMQNPFVREISLKLLQDPEIAARYKICPAAKTIHHAFLGGLLVHSLQLIHLVDAILPFYEDIDRDVLVFGCAFHDFGKIFELSFDGGFGYTDEGRLVGHIAIATALLDRKMREIPGFPQALEFHLKHLILSHHGRLDYGSPKRPATIEAQILHHLDDMDSKINSIQTFMKAERNTSRWTGHHRAYDQYYYKPDVYLKITE